MAIRGRRWPTSTELGVDMGGLDEDFPLRQTGAFIIKKRTCCRFNVWNSYKIDLEMFGFRLIVRAFERITSVT